MAKVLIRAGAEIDVPTRAEVAEDLRSIWEEQREIESARERERLRTMKRVELFIPVSPAANNVFIGQTVTANEGNGPELGYIWSVRLVSITLSGTGTLTVYKSSSSGDTRRPVFYNGTGQPVQVALWSADQLRLRPGEGLYIVGSTTLTAVFMSAWEIAAEREGELV